MKDLKSFRTNYPYATNDETMKEEEKIKEEMKLQFEAGNLKIDEEELEQEQFYPQYIMKASLPNTKKLEILRMIFKEETRKECEERIRLQGEANVGLNNENISLLKRIRGERKHLIEEIEEIVHPDIATPKNFPPYSLTAWNDRNKFISFILDKLEALKKRNTSSDKEIV